MDQWIGFAGKITGKLAGVYSQRQRGSYTTIGEQSAINPLQVPFNQFLQNKNNRRAIAATISKDWGY